uniref:Plant-specific domain TIGR01589 family protein n=1 Tax=Leersia perrieri TaxID=77586 RepID=A0A0D9VSL3_9ORYZ
MALGDDSPASYIHMVQHLIERCMTFGMSMEECMETLSKRADVQPVVTSTVWKELEKENKEFFDKYRQLRSEKGGAVSSSS